MDVFVNGMPREFDLQARNPANTVHIGGDHMVFGAGDAIRAELDDYVSRRRIELGD